MKKLSIDLVEQARQLRLQAEALESSARLARGTRPNVVAQNDKRAPVQPRRSEHFVGDNGSTEQLMSTIATMLSSRPWRFAELLEATGARDNRIKGVIMRLQREGVRVVDVAPAGTGKALWFIPSDDAMRRIAVARKKTMRGMKPRP